MYEVECKVTDLAKNFAGPVVMVAGFDLETCLQYEIQGNCFRQTCGWNLI